MVHGGVGALDDLGEGCVVLGVVVGDAVGDDDAAADVLGVVEGGHHLGKILAVVVVLAAEDGCEFVAADPVDGAVFVDMGDGACGLLDEFVAFGMAVGVIDMLESVHVTDDDGKGTCCPIEYVFVDLLFFFKEEVFAGKSGETVQICQAECFGLLFFAADLFVNVADADDDVGVIVVFHGNGFELDV